MPKSDFFRTPKCWFPSWLAPVFLALAGAIEALAGPPVITNPPASQTIFIGDAATFQVGATGTAPLSYQWLRNGTVLSGATSNSLVFATAAADDHGQFTVQITNTAGAVTSAPAVLTLDFGTAGPVQTNRWLELTNVWRYNVSKANLGTAWLAPGYADGGWASGGGLLYVEDSALPAAKTTALPATAGSLPTTCYFRTRVTNGFANAYALSFVANTVIDDGVVLYLNGAEAFRLGMPTGAVAYSTLANRTVGNAVWEGPFDFPATNLVAGTNVLAAEVHQSATNSTDIVMGLTLDAVWQPRLRDTNAPSLTNVVPAAGSTLTALTQIEVQFSEGVRGVDAADLRIAGLAATNVVVVSPVDYLFQFPQPAAGAVNVTWAPGHAITDLSANSNAFNGVGFGFTLTAPSTATQLAYLEVVQSSDAAATNGAARAVDGSATTFSLTADQPGSYWLARLGRPYPVERIELVNRAAPDDVAMQGLALRLYNLDDQVVFQTNLVNPGSSGTLVLPVPAGVAARSLWIGLPGTQTNGAGSHRVGLAEVRLMGSPNMPYGPAPVAVGTNAVRVWQSSDYSAAYPASNAVNGDPGDFTHTANVVNSYWMADLGRAVPIDSVQIVNRSGCCDTRLSGLVLRIFDAGSNTVASTVLTNPGMGGTWSYAPAAGTLGRWLRVGLENGQTNGGGNYYVSLAEARVFSGGTNVLVLSPSVAAPVTNNLASFQRSYMVRLSQSIPAASNANDDSYTTETKTTTQTVDGYWEVDLGATYALYGVRTIGASGITYRLTNTICRLYDEAHDSVFARKLTGTPDVFDTDVNGPVFARYVRVGLEDKQRTDPAGGLEWYIGMREVEVFGRPTNQVGVLSFSAATNRVASGQPVALAWAVADVQRVEIHPALGSVGAFTAASGDGTVLVTPTKSTEYLLVASNAAGLFCRGAGVLVGGATLPVRISEVVAENQYSLNDGYGEASDWIELRNTGDAPVNLAGYGLSDNPALPMKWVFPSTNLAPHSTLVVFASGRDTPLDPAGNLHASFRLDSAGGSVVLTAPDGTNTVDSLPGYPALDTDLAYGRDLEGHWTLMEPTPGRVNSGTTYLGWLKPLDWSHARGFYQAAFTLTLTNGNAGASVFYSLDGSLPSLPYTNGIAIAGTKAVRVQVARPGYRSPRIQTKTFIFLDDVITSAVMNTTVTQDPNYAPRMKPGLLALPTISLVLTNTPTYDEQEGSMEVLWPGGANAVQQNCGIYQFGGSWQTFAKKSLTLAFRSLYGAGKLHTPLFDGFDHGVLPKTSFDKLELGAGNQDMNARGFYMADRFVQDSLLDMGSLNPHGRFIHVYLNGVYWGQYNCKEVLMENFLADYLGGTADDYVSVKGNDNVGDNFVLGTPDAPHTQPWERVVALRSSYAAVSPYLDVTHLIDFLLLWNYGDAESEFRACGTREAGSGFKFWMNDADGFLRTNSLGLNRTVRNGPGDLFSGLVAEGHPDFKTLLADRIYRHFFNQGGLTPAANDARLAVRMLEIHDSLLAECARWGYRTPANWESSSATIRSTLFPARTGQLVGYLRSGGLYPAFDPPAFNQFGGLVTNGFKPQLTSSDGTIYYTLDGSDPRLAGGAISSQARVWSADALTITNDLTLNVRVLAAGGQWSALAQPRYLLAARRAPTARDLLVTEINYNPAGSDDYEFIELWNSSSNLLDLSGVTLSNAVRFVFPSGSALAPGAFVLVVKSAPAFAARYQSPGSPYYMTNLAVAGVWSGSLDNSGETLSLMASNGLELSSVPYQTSGDWPERGDGKGSSIELHALPPAAATDAEVRALVADGSNWGASSLYQGSPGRFDTFVKSVRLSEVLSHTDITGDWLELWNSGAQPVDLSGCTLTDNLDLPARWAFPSNTVMAPGQFLVLTSAQLGFAFSELGDDAALLQMSGTNVIRFLDTVDFPAANREETFGLFQRSDGVLDFTELRAGTPGSANALPRVGPIVMSEILFAPEPGKAEFIELANLGGASVPLYDPLHPTNVWKLEGVGSYAFPPGLSLAPCSTLIVCATNATAFRAQYGLAPSVPVIGPWSGALANDGETLKLLQPGDPELDGTVPYYRVDHVTYRTNAPWPQTLAGGSLERVPVEAYGNDPADWRAGPVGGTPGVAAANRLPVIGVTGNLRVPQQTALALTLAVADLDVPWQRVALAPTQLPAGASYDPVSRTLSWSPAPAQGPGDYPAQFIATDTAACGTNWTVLQLTLQVTPPLVVNAQFLGGGLLVSFAALAGETYRVEFCTDLALADWQLLQEISATQNDVVTVSDPGVGPDTSRFYRVRWLQP